MEYKTLQDMIIENSKLDQKGIIFISGETNEQFVSYKQLYNDAIQLLGSFQSKGIKEDDLLVFQINDNYEFVTAFWACILGRIVPVPLAVGTSEDIYGKMFRVCNILDRPYVLFDEYGNKQFEKYISKSNNDIHYEDIMNAIKFKEMDEYSVKGNIVKCCSDDLAFIQFSSGSTGDPKGVMLTHGNLVANTEGILEGLNLNTEDTSLSWMPLTHDMGLIGFHISPFRQQINQYLMPTSLFVHSPLLWLKKATEHAITVLASPNFGYTYFLKAFDRRPVEDLDLSSVRIIFNGAEPISLMTCQTFLDRMHKYGLKNNTMFNVYGLAEACLAVAFPKVMEEMRYVQVDGTKLGIGEHVSYVEEAKNVDCVIEGKAVKYCSIKITDDNDEEVSEDVVGYIKIKGTNVTKGYYNNEIETARIIDSQGWLNTGDLGFFHDGNLVVTGRAKDIIFINGMNFFSHDIENLIIEKCKIVSGKVAVAGYHNSHTEKEDIIVFIVHRGNIEKFIEIADQITSLIWNKLGIKITRVVPVIRIPKTTSGKIQRFKLVESYCKGEMSERLEEIKVYENSMSSGSVLEDENVKAFASIVSEIYHVDDHIMEKKLWELEGDSLTAYQFCAQLNSKFQTQIEIYDLFKSNTLQEVYAYTQKSSAKTYNQIEKVAEAKEYELSPEQKRMYLLHKLNPESTSYNVPIVLKVSGKLDITKFESAILKLINYQKILSANFFEHDGTTYQSIREVDAFHMKIINGREKSIEEIYHDFVRAFDLENELLVRAAYAVDKNKDTFVLFDFHHIVCDGSSLGNMIHNLISFYNDSDVLELPVSYLDYSNWRNQSITLMDKEKEFFGKVLKDIPEKLEFKTSRNDDGFGDEASSNVFYIDNELYGKIKQLLNEKQITLYNFLLGAYSIMLSLYTDQDEMVIGSPFAARTRSELFDLVGVFINTIPVPCKINYSDSTYLQYLNELKTLLLSIYSHQDYPYEMIVKDLSKQNNNLGKDAIYQTMFTLQNMDIPDFVLGDAALKVYDCEVKDAKFDLSMEAMPEQDGVKIKLVYRKSAFSKQIAEQMSELYIRVIENMVQDINMQISGLDVVYTKEEKELVGAVDTSGITDITTRYRDVFSNYADKTAVSFEGSSLSYKELYNNIRKIKRYIQSNKAGEQGYIPIIASAQLNLVSAMLGVWESGNAFIPIDPDYPEEMIQNIIEDCNADFVIVQREYAKKIGTHKSIILEDAINEQIDDFEAVDIAVNRNDIVYAIYTSGTTGKHKGVKISNRNLMNYVNWFRNEKDISSEDKTMLMSSHCFDLGYTALFSSILSGAELHILSKERFHDPDYILNYIKREKITYLKLTPSLLHMMVLCNTFEKESVLDSIRLIVMGGETVRIKDVQNISGKYKNITFMNHYGPTETTIGTIFKELDEEMIHKKKWTNVIGRPITNMRARICNHNGIIVPQDVAGELILMGENVSEGYINNEQFTKERFFTIEEDGIRYKAFRTGDLCRINQDGEIEFIDRIDKQIKIRGFRIETTQIANALRECSNVEDAIVMKHNGEDMAEALCAYLVGNCDIEAVKKELKNKLPYYMIPTYFAKIGEIPVTDNGKVNYKELPLIKPNNNTSISIVVKNKMESDFIEVWKKVLAQENVYDSDDFFACGGDSIKAVELVSELSKKDIKLEVNKVLQYPSVNDLLGLLKIASNKTDQGAVTGEIKLTPIQRRFFEGQEHVDVYNQSIMVKCSHNMSGIRLNQVLAAVTEHHDALRMHFDYEQNVISQINGEVEQCWELYEWRLEDGQTIESLEVKQRINEIEESMNLSSGKLIKVVLIHGDTDYVFITIHHLIMDGVSWRLLIRDLDKAYSQLTSGQKIDLGAKTASFMTWSNQLYDSVQDSDIISYWKNQMEQTEYSLYKDFNNDNGTYADNVVYEYEFATEDIDQLRLELGRVYNTDISNILLATFINSVQELASKECIRVYMESHGRSDLNKKIDVSSTIGWFTSIYPITVDLKRKEISDIVIEVKEKNKRIPYLGIGYGMLRYLDNNDIARIEEESISFNYLGDFDNVVQLDNFEDIGKKVNLYVEKERKRPYMLTLECMIVDKKIQFRINYSKNQYSEETIRTIASKMIDTLHAIYRDCIQSDSVVMTPSDFGDDELTMDEIDAIAGML